MKGNENQKGKKVDGVRSNKGKEVRRRKKGIPVDGCIALLKMANPKVSSFSLAGTHQTRRKSKKNGNFNKS